jgi:hypothetical protein
MYGITNPRSTTMNCTTHPACQPQSSASRIAGACEICETPITRRELRGDFGGPGGLCGTCLREWHDQGDELEELFPTS